MWSPGRDERSGHPVQVSMHSSLRLVGNGQMERSTVS